MNDKLKKLYNVPKEASQAEVIRALAEGVAPALDELAQRVKEMGKVNRYEEEQMNRIASENILTRRAMERIEANQKELLERVKHLEEVLYANIKAK